MASQLLLMTDTGQYDAAETEEEVEFAEEIWTNLIDEMTLGLCFDVHRSVKLGLMVMDEMTEEAQQEYEIVDQPGLDIFGQPPLKKQLECMCPNCHRNLAANRFAPHLEKCMGMGRISRRIASKRIAIASTAKLDSDEDDDRDVDWTFSVKGSKKGKKDKQSNNSPRKPSKAKLKNDLHEIAVVGNFNFEGCIANFKALGNCVPVFETLSQEERKHILMNMCGVISEHTKKLCTKSLRCPQHTDEMRHEVRRYLLNLEAEDRLRHKDGVLETDEIDIDTYDDNDSQTLRERLNRLNQWDAISNPSPAESTSTTNSNEGQASKKRKKGGKLTHRKKTKQRPPSAQSQASTGSAALPYEVLD